MSEMEKVFDDLWRTPSAGAAISPARSTFTPAVDLRETDDFFLVSVDLPGVNPKDIHVDIQDGRLSISGERMREEKREEKGFRRFERSYGGFERSFQLPANVDEAKIQARCENGVLEVMLPKSEVAKPRQVQINAEKGGLFSRVLGQKNVEAKGESEAKPTTEKH
jgi:HSP20 family protein